MKDLKREGEWLVLLALLCIASASILGETDAMSLTGSLSHDGLDVLYMSGNMAPRDHIPMRCPERALPFTLLLGDGLRAGAS